MDVQDPVNSDESDAGSKKPSGTGIAARTRSRTNKPAPEADPVTSKTRSKRPRCLDKICSICGKRNKNQAELEEHLKIHTIECNFQCLCCERWFKSKKRVYNHLQNQHSIHKEESLKDFVKVIGRSEEEEEEKKREVKNKRKEEIDEKPEESKRTRHSIKEENKEHIEKEEKKQEGEENKQEAKSHTEENKLVEENNGYPETKEEEIKKEEKAEKNQNKEIRNISKKEEFSEEIKIEKIIEIKKEREDDDDVEVINNEVPLNTPSLFNATSDTALNGISQKEDKLLDGNLWTVPPSNSSSPPPSGNFKREVEIPTIPFEFKKQIHSFLEGKFHLEDLEGKRCGIVRSCPVCCKILSRPSDLQRHMMKHTGERPYACNLCESRFKSVYNLNYHQRAAHGIMVKISPAMEVRLNKRRRTRRLAPVAKKSSNESSPAKLSPDENGFSIKQEELSSESTPSFDPPTLLGTLLEKKTVSQESSSKPNCPVSVFPSNTSSYNPPPLNSPPSASVKPKIESPFSWDNLDIRGEKPLITKIEGIHRITEQNYVLYKCCICDSMHPSLEILCAHMVSQHPTNKDNTCLKCGATFKWRSQLEVHEQVHQVIDPPGAINPNMMLMGSFNFPMMMGSLPQSLLSPATLMSPQSYFSIPHQVNPYVNSGLFPTYGQNPAMETPQSEQASLQPSSKSDHLASKDCTKENAHSIAEVYTQYPYKCRHCPKSFDRLFSVQRHERIHTGVKPCFCKICGRGFSEKRNLRHHIIRFHSDNSVNTKKDALKPRTLRPNTSRKLVSFLKKTAVRILNSAEHNKQDSSKESSIKEEEDHSSNSPDIKNNDTSSSSTVEMDSSYHLEGEPEDITVVIPKEVCDEAVQEENASCAQLLDGDKKEILHDPKRSLIGNRRKGIPVKYTANQHQDHWKPSLLNFSNLHVDMPPLENDKASLESPDCKNDEFLEKNSLVVKNSFGGSRSSFNLLEFANQCQLKAPFSNFRKKLRQNGSILQAYSCLKTEPLEAKKDEDSSVLYNYTRPFKCEFCEYSSRTNSQLKVHMMRHAGIKQYLCKICKYNGVTQSDLNRHYKTRTHFLRARHTCPICGLGFYTPGQTEDHIQSRHKSSSMADNPAGTEEEGELPSSSAAVACLQEG